MSFTKKKVPIIFYLFIITLTVSYFLDLNLPYRDFLIINSIIVLLSINLYKRYKMKN
jgi:hypothetical protein